MFGFDTSPLESGPPLENANMKFLPLIWAGLWRKPARTLLTLLSIVIAFMLFGLLQGVDAAFARIIGEQKLDRMFVDPRFGQPIPYSYKAQIEQVEGIKRLTEVHFMGGYYRDMQNGLGVIFTIPSIWLAIRPEFEIPKAQVDAVAGTRTAVIVSDFLASHNGWKLGDHISIKGGIPKKDGSPDWTFDIVGVMHYTGSGDSRNILANYKYLDEARASGAGVVSRFLLRIDDASQAGRIARDIDALFANSPVTTRTQSEQDQAQSSLAQIGDFKFFTRAIMAAVFFALLFLTLNTTMESVRERTSEIGTLKTLGYPDRSVLVLVLAESVALFIVGTCIGLAIAAMLFPMAGNFIGVKRLPMLVFAIGTGLAIGAAIVSAMVPAWRARSLSIVQALAVR
jgi:putative ABC transport system permease protein